MVLSPTISAPCRNFAWRQSYGWTSLRTRLRLSRHLRRNRVQIAHAFDFYTNLTLIPAARLARVPVVIGSHRQIGTS